MPEAESTGLQHSPAVAAGSGQGAGVVNVRLAEVALDEILPEVPAYLEKEVLGISIGQMVLAFVLILLGLLAQKVFKWIMEGQVIPRLEKTRFEFDVLLARAANRPLSYLLLLCGFGGAAMVMPLPTDPDIAGFALAAFKLLLGLMLIWFLFRIVDVIVVYLEKLARGTDSKLDDQLIPVLRKSLKATIGVVCGVWVIQLLGYNVSSLLAGLGIGGLAVALALQDTLSNFFGSVFIFLDRPFKVGDWIKTSDVEGIVEQIGFRSTRVRTWPATLVSVPNKIMANCAVDNWSEMPKRRVKQVVGVTYETTADEMEEAVQTVRDIIEGDEGVDPEFIVVRFEEFGSSSLNILVYYFTLATTLDEHLQTKERINLAIMRALRGMGLSIAFPTQSIYLEGDVAREISASLGHKAGPFRPQRGKE
jgi:MscS family membrane protein